MAAQTIVGDPLGGSPYVPPAKPRAPMGSVFNTGVRRAGREAQTTVASELPPGGRFDFARKAPAPEPVPEETVIGSELGGEIVPPP